MSKENRIAKRITDDMVRMRSQPRFFDYCYLSARNNLLVIRKLLSLTRHFDNYTVLDLGCGNKPFRRLFPMGINYIGIDFSSKTSADILHDLRGGIPIANSSADIVILSEALEHLPDPFHILSEVERILKPGGYLFISTPFALPIHGRPYDFFRFTEYFYRGLEKQYGLRLVQMKYSNTIFSTPLLLILNILIPLPLIPYQLKQAFSMLVNIIVAVGDALVEGIIKIAGKDRLASFARSFPLGYAVLFVKGVTTK